MKCSVTNLRNNHLIFGETMFRKTILIMFMLFVFSTVSFAAEWNIDKDHSSLNFSVRHMVVSKTKGYFSEFEGSANFENSDLAKGSVSFTVKMSSIDTDNQKRDEHLRSSDFFDVEKYPEMSFTSTKVSDIEGENFKLIGNLTIKDVTKEVVFSVENFGQITDPWGNTRVGFSAKTKINRQDFNITWSNVLETGGLIVSDQVNIELELEWIKAKTEEASVN